MFLWLIKSNISFSDMFFANLSCVFLTFMLRKFWGRRGEKKTSKQPVNGR